jgi:hypothetical protein
MLTQRGRLTFRVPTEPLPTESLMAEPFLRFVRSYRRALSVALPHLR